MPSIQGQVYAVERTSESAPLPFTIGETLDAALAVMKREWLVLSLAQIIAALPGTAIALGMHFAFGEAKLFTRAYYEETLVSIAVSSIIAAFFRGGIVKMSLDAARGKKPTLADLARGARFFPAMLAIEVMQMIAIVFGVALLFIPYALVWMGFVLASMWRVDGEKNLIASLRASWRATRGERLHLFGFVLVTLVIAYLGVLACCVGTFPADAFSAVATAHVYLRLSGEPAGKA